MDVFRCKECKKGVHSDRNIKLYCPKCGSRQWIPTNRLSLWEKIKFARETGVWLKNADGVDKNPSLGR
jgi:hypothetical protein